VGSDPEQLAATLRELARLDPVELGLEVVLERIVKAAATGCDSTGGVGLLLLGPDDQLRYVVAGAGPDASWPAPRSGSPKAPRWTRSCRPRRSPAATLPPSRAGPTFARWHWRRASGRG
jgi:hypothetical protein